MIRNPNRSIAANPVLVGAITTLVVIVAVYLSYNANDGLPFVPTSKVVLQLDNGVTVGPDSDVREGGYRIGVVDEVRVARLPNGHFGAEAVLKIDQTGGRLPADSRFAVRLKGAIGGKYIEVQRGTSPRELPQGAVVPPGRTTLPVELDDVLATFDEDTRRGQQQSLRGIGGALASRGPALNATVSRLPDTLGALGPVMANLAAAPTGLTRAIAESADLVRVLAPVSGVQARLFGDLATTFGAVARDDAALRATFTEYARTARAGIAQLRTIRPVTRRTATVVRDARATARSLRASLPAFNDALATAVGPLRRGARLGDDLDGALKSLGRLVRDPLTPASLRALAASARTLQTQLRFYGPQITVCNVANLWLTFVPDVISGPSPTGTGQLGMPEIAGHQDDGLGEMGANEVATGRGVLPGMTPQHVHSDPFARAIHPDGSADCELGQQGYVYAGNANDDTPDRFYQRAVLDTGRMPDIGEGPTYRRYDQEGRGSGAFLTQVPKGMVYRRNPGGRAFPEVSKDR